MRRVLIRPAVLILALVLASCGDEPSKAEKAAAKRARDAELLALPYPRSSGVQPASIQITHDGATDRTSMTLRLAGLRVGGRSASSVSNATLYLTSSHKGRVRPSDDPEGSVDGNIVVQSSASGVLAFSGAPGSVAVGGESRPLKKASGKDAYSPAKTGRGGEESLRFRFPTQDLIAAVQQDPVRLSFGTIQIEIAGAQLADLREFAARLNPRP